MRSHEFTILLLAALAMAGPAVPAAAADPRPPKPLTVDAIRAWQRSGGLRAASRDWTLERSLDLNGRGHAELLLAVGGGESGLVFALFSRDDGPWRLVGENIRATPPLLDALPRDSRDVGHPQEWHDLAAFERRGSDGYSVRVYRWNGSGYAETAVHADASGNSVRIVDAGAAMPAPAAGSEGAKPAATVPERAGEGSGVKVAPAAEPAAQLKADGKGAGWWHHPDEPRRPTVMPRRR